MRAILALMALFGGIQGRAQDQPEIASQEAPITFSSRVNLISVPVVVRDKDGRAIGNLRKEDFVIFDRGKQQAITRFSVDQFLIERNDHPPEVPNSGAVTGSLPESYAAYLVDDVHLDPGDLLNTRQALVRHIDESADPRARAAIFTTSGITLIDFSSDRAKLREAVNKIQPYTSGIDRAQGCPSVSYAVADQLVNQKLYLDGRLFPDQQLYALITSGSEPLLTAAFNEALNCSGGCNGNANKDAISGLPLCVIQALVKLRDAARQAIVYGDRETGLSLGALNDVIRKLSVMPGNRNLVLVSPGFLLTRDHRVPEDDIFERAVRANVVINTIDVRGVFTTIPDGRQPESARKTEDVLAELASATGGTFFHNSNDLKGGLQQIAARPEYIYVLGFSPDVLKYDGSYHSLKVTAKNASNFTIQARRGYWAPAHAVDEREAAKEEIQETVFSRAEIQGIPLDVQTEFFDSGDSKFELTVKARLDAGALGFQKAQDRNNDTLTVVAGLFDPNGNYVAGLQKVFDLHLRDRTLETFRHSGMNVEEVFHVAPGRYLVRVVVRDAGGKTVTAKNAGVEIP
jgi:VWFA-related protein